MQPIRCRRDKRPATLRLPFKEKLSYGIGDLASNILLDIGTLYLLKFYTDVLGLPGTYGGIIFLISKFFTAFTDMGTGIMLDSRRKIGPKGKFRPFILYASFPVTLLAIANFIGTPFDVTGKTVMATILFKGQAQSCRIFRCDVTHRYSPFAREFPHGRA